MYVLFAVSLLLFVKFVSLKKEKEKKNKTERKGLQRGQSKALRNWPEDFEEVAVSSRARGNDHVNSEEKKKKRLI